jgi:hypothetical protein
VTGRTGCGLSAKLFDGGLAFRGYRYRSKEQVFALHLAFAHLFFSAGMGMRLGTHSGSKEMVKFMRIFNRRHAVVQALAVALVAAFALGLSACGGADGDVTTNTSTPAGAAATPPPVASDLALTLSSGSMQNGGTETVTATVTAVDGNRNLLPNIPVTIRVDANATAGVSGAVTDVNGVVTARVGIGADRANRVIVITVNSGELTRTAAIQVTGARLSATALPASVAPGGAGRVLFRLTDINARSIPEQEILVNGVGGVEVRGTTDINGEYPYSYTAPSTAGTLDVRASSAGTSITQSVVVLPSTGVIPPVTEVVRAASLSLSGDRVAANAVGSSNRVEVRALFLHDDNRPARGVRVRFSLPDPFSVGGTMSTGSALVYSDATGVASASYIPSSRSSPTDGVVVRACWSPEDFATGTACPAERLMEARLTVVSEPLSVSIGTDKFIIKGPTRIDYVKRFLVQVNDASGAPMADIQLTAVLDLLGYYVGNWYVAADPFTGKPRWFQRVALGGAMCPNEDLNRNGAVDAVAIDAAPGSLSEDANGNRQLDPRKADVVLTFEGSSRTDASGQGVLRITYPESVASWIRFRIDVVARGVAGSEGRAWIADVLPVLAEDVNDGGSTPAFVNSPYNDERFTANTSPTASMDDYLEPRTYSRVVPVGSPPANFILCTRK